MLNADKFDKPLGEWIEEETPVTKNEYDPDKKTFVTTTKIEKTKTMYVNAPKLHYRCRPGEHFFICIDNHKYIFRCTKCRYSRMVYPTTYSFDEQTGSLIHLVTKQKV